MVAVAAEDTSEAMDKITCSLTDRQMVYASHAQNVE